MTPRPNPKSALLLSLLVLMPAMAAVTPDAAQAFRVAIYVDGFRVGDFDTWDPHWWTTYPWGMCSADLGDDGTGISIGLAEGTIDDVLPAFIDGKGSPREFMRAVLDHPLNRELYAEGASPAADPGRSRPRPPEWVEIELAEADETALPDIVLIDDLEGLAARPDVEKITLRQTRSRFQPCRGGFVGWVSVFAGYWNGIPIYQMVYCPGDVD